MMLELTISIETVMDQAYYRMMVQYDELVRRVQFGGFARAPN